MVSTSFKNEVLKKYHEGKLAHAFLLETDDIDRCYKDVLDLIKQINCPFEYVEECDKDCNLCNLIDNDNLPSLVTIEPDKQVIKRDSISELMDKFSTMPVFSKYNSYIIKEAHRLNSESANTILKFLEEPEDNIIGFFITNNKENVLATIRSRCQIFYCKYDLGNNLSNIDENYLIDVKLYLNSIYKNKDDLLYNKTHMSGYYKEREEWEIFFYTMFYYLKDCYMSLRTDKIDLVKEISRDNLLKIILLVETIIKYIDANTNMDMILDKFVIEMRKYYE